MVELACLLCDLDYEVQKGSEYIMVDDIAVDSREVSEGQVFVCVRGACYDGHDYIDEVIKKGAVAIICEQQIYVEAGVTIIIVDNSRRALAYMSAAFFDHPADKIITIGITGTKGKTTTAYMIYTILQAAGIETALIGSIETILKSEHLPAVNTTPDAYFLQAFFAKAISENCKVVVMEVSSQGLLLDRTAGFIFNYGVYTNLGIDHISKREHKDFEDYKNCKAKLFTQSKIGILNSDDIFYEDMIKSATCSIETYGFDETADVYGTDESLYSDKALLGTRYKVHHKGIERSEITLEVPGRFNIYNSMAAIAVCVHFITDFGIMERALRQLRLKGRTEIIASPNGITVIIDYAHNAMSLFGVLSALTEYEHNRIITVFGCGGNRDVNRRFEMGRVSAELSDITVVTSDNPRYENPDRIINDIVTGIKSKNGVYTAITDRKEAVLYAIQIAKEGDIVLISGKGHEEYQIIGDKRINISDRDIILKVNKLLEKKIN